MRVVGTVFDAVTQFSSIEGSQTGSIMPNTTSAKKRLKQSLASRARNRAVKSEVKTVCKRVLAAVEAKTVDKAEAEFRLAAKTLDQAAAKRTIHRNAAARTKSRLSAKVKALKGK